MKASTKPTLCHESLPPLPAKTSAPFCLCFSNIDPKVYFFFMLFKKIMKIFLSALSAGRDRCPSHTSHQGTGRSPVERQHAAVASSPVISYIRSADRSEKPFSSPPCVFKLHGDLGTPLLLHRAPEQDLTFTQ